MKYNRVIIISRCFIFLYVYLCLLLQGLLYVTLLNMDIELLLNNIEINNADLGLYDGYLGSRVLVQFRLISND